MTLPLNAELDAESAGGKLAERIRDDPKRDENSNEEDKDTDKREQDQTEETFCLDGTDMIVRRRPMYWLVKPATAPPLY